MKSELSENLKFYRKQHGLTQAQVAEAVGINRSTYTYYESGASAPNIAILVQIAKLFDVSYSSLIGEDPNVYGVADTDDGYSRFVVPLSGDEAELIRRFRLMSGCRKSDLLRIAEMYEEETEEC